MKKYISILAIAAVCVLSCKKGNVSGEDVIRSEKISGLEFRANLPSLTRTVLGTDGLSLKWTASDQIAVWSVPMGTMAEFEATAEHLYEDYGFNPAEEELGIVTRIEAMHNGVTNGTTVCETLSVIEGAGSTSATFHSEKPARDWFGDLSSIEDDLYWFAALYPASALVTAGGAPAFTTWGQLLPKDAFNLMNDYVVPHPFIKVNVPSVQDGKSYWNYQVVYNTGLYEYEGRMARNLVTAKEVLYNEYPVTFDKWVVGTSLLEFTLKAADTGTYAIKTIDITYESPDYYSGSTNYYDDFFALSGTVPIQFILDEEYEVFLHNRFCEPYPYMWYIHQDDSVNAWSEMAGASPKVTLSFADPVSLSGGNAADGLFYAVVIPTMDNQNQTSDGKKPRIRFTAYDAAGNEILGKVLQMGNTYNYKGEREVYPGIFKGTKYSFNLELNPVTSPEAGNAGEYEEIVLN